MKSNSGFAMVDLTAMIVLLVVAAAIAATSLPATRQANMAAACRSNLKAINSAMALYGTENGDMVPILPDMGLVSKAPNYREELKMGPRRLAKDLGQGAQQNLCLLVMPDGLNWSQFICPATGHVPATRDNSRKYGMGEPGKTYIDYAIQIPYVKTIDGDNMCRLTNNMNPKVVFLADRAPRKDLAIQWSPNHGTAGENVLLGDGSTRWYGEQYGKPNAAGFDGNNIYTADKWRSIDDDPGSPPALVSNGTESKTPTEPFSQFDSVLCGQ